MPTSSQALILTHVFDSKVSAQLKCRVPSCVPLPLSTVTFGGERLTRCRGQVSRYEQSLKASGFGPFHGGSDSYGDDSVYDPNSGKVWEAPTHYEFRSKTVHPIVSISPVDKCSRWRQSPVSEGCLKVGCSNTNPFAEHEHPSSKIRMVQHGGLHDSRHREVQTSSPSSFLSIPTDLKAASDNDVRIRIRKLVDLGFRVSDFKGELPPPLPTRGHFRSSASKTSSQRSSFSKPSASILSSFTKTPKRLVLKFSSDLEGSSTQASEGPPTLVENIMEAIRKAKIIRPEQLPSVEKQKLAALQKKIGDLEDISQKENSLKPVLTEQSFNFEELVLLSAVESTPFAELPPSPSEAQKPAAKYKPPVIRMRKELPPPDRTQLCFSLKNSNLSHKEVKELLENHTSSKIASLRYDPVYMHLDRETAGENANLVMWVFRLQEESQTLSVLNRGLEIGGQFLRVRYYDDVLREEHVAYRMLREVEEEKMRKSLTKKKMARKKNSRISITAKKKNSGIKKSGRSTPVSEEEMPADSSQLYFHAKS